MAAPLISSVKAYNAAGTGATVNSADFLLSGGGAGVPVAGDRLYFFFSTDTGTATLTPPAGLTALGAQLNTDGSMNSRGWYVDLVGAPEVSYAFTHDGAAGPTRLDAICVKPNGNTFAAQTQSQVDTPGATSLASTALTGGNDERVLLLHAVNDGEAITVPPAGMTLLQSQATDAFSGYSYMQTGVGTGAQSRTVEYGAIESIAVFAVMLSYSSAPAVGPVITQPGVTNASGQATATLTSDHSLEPTAGAVVLVTFTRGGVTLRTTARPDNP